MSRSTVTKKKSAFAFFLAPRSRSTAFFFFYASFFLFSTPLSALVPFSLFSSSFVVVFTRFHLHVSVCVRLHFVLLCCLLSHVACVSTCLCGLGGSFFFLFYFLIPFVCRYLVLLGGSGACLFVLFACVRVLSLHVGLGVYVVGRGPSLCALSCSLFLSFLSCLPLGVVVFFTFHYT